MKKQTNYTVPFRRKRDGSTNYRKRLKVLVSNKPRLVARRSLKSIQASIVDYSSKGDVVRVSAHSAQLKKFGWQYGTGNLPAAYLVGFMLGKKAKKTKLEHVIFDIGFHKSIKGARVYALLAGALDAGLNIPHNKEILPEKDRLNGRHIADYANKLKATEEEYKKQFGRYLKENKDPINIVKNFEDTKKNIESKV